MPLKSFLRNGGFLAAFLALAPTAAFAQQQTADQQVLATAGTTRGVSPLVVPLPMADPSLGNGLVVASALFYSPVQGGRPWVTGVGGLYTNNKDWGILMLQQADLMNGHLRLSGAGGYGDFNLNFFGIGQAAGSRGVSIKLNETGEVLVLNGLYQVHGQFYAGLRYRFLSETTKLAEPIFPNHPILPDAQFTTRISGLGPAFEYDSRNVQFQPSKGLYIEGQWLFDGKGLGSSFTYDKLTLSANAYFPLGPRTVFAMRGSVCDAGGGAPFYDLCFFGSNHDLRGYEGGRYRDSAMLAGQMELRQHLFWRLGAVAFGGVGGVGKSVTDLGEALPAGGLGLRLQPSRKLPVNVSIDYAWGKNSEGLYLYVGEAF
ncbi:MAG: BamA/TamA family outer membrane protein [Caulobacteraceae bacterium]